MNTNTNRSQEPIASAVLSRAQMLCVLDSFTYGETFAKSCRDQGISPATFLYALKDYSDLSRIFKDLTKAHVGAEIMVMNEREDRMLDEVRRSPALASPLTSALKTLTDNTFRRAEKLAPKSYGTKIDMTTDGEKIESIVWNAVKTEKGEHADATRS